MPHDAGLLSFETGAKRLCCHSDWNVVPLLSFRPERSEVEESLCSGDIIVIEGIPPLRFAPVGMTMLKDVGKETQARVPVLHNFR
jgi:hypothetical protein